MKVSHSEIVDFFRNLYPVEPWPGAIRFDIMELWKDENGKKKARLRNRFFKSSLKEIADMEETPALDILQQQGYHFFYTPALQMEGESGHKDHSVAISALWCDVDHVTEEEMKQRLAGIPLYPTGVVRTGGGYHLYWKLDKYYEVDESLEDIMRRIKAWVGGDHTTNINRLLRVPGTWNCKPEYEGPQHVRLEQWSTAKTYKLSEFYRTKIAYGEIRLKDEFKSKYILQGVCDLGQNPSRSERDYVIIKELLVAGHTEQEVVDIMMNPEFGCSDRAIESGEKYVRFTIEKARTEVTADTGASIYDDGHCIFKRVMTENGPVVLQLSNFCIAPQQYIDIVDDSITLYEADLHYGKKIRRLNLPATSLVSWKDFISFAGMPGLSWTGNNVDWHRYVKYLTDKEVPDRLAASTVGWCEGGFVLTKETWFKPEIIYAHVGKHPPEVIVEDASHLPWDKMMKDLITYTKLLHKPSIAVPALGWFMASVFCAPIRAEYSKQFPLLCLHGQRGSGKTTLARTFLNHLLGVQSEYTMETTLAVMRRALAGSNSLPVYMDEYEHSKHPKVVQINATLRNTYQASSAQRFDTAKDDVLELPMLAPTVVTTITGFEDDALIDRTYNIRVTPFDKENGARGLEWFRKIPMGSFLKWWTQQDPSEWIQSIGALRRMVDTSERQAMSFAVSAAPLLYMARRFDWDLSLEDLQGYWQKNQSTLTAMAPHEAVDTVIAYLVRNNRLVVNMDISLDTPTELWIHLAKLLDESVIAGASLDINYPISRKWIQKTLKDGLDFDHLSRYQKPKSIGGTVKRCAALNLQYFPLTSEAVRERLPRD